MHSLVANVWLQITPFPSTNHRLYVDICIERRYTGEHSAYAHQISDATYEGDLPRRYMKVNRR